MIRVSSVFVAVGILTGLVTFGLPTAASPPSVPEKQNDGVVIPLQGNFLKLQVRGDNIIRVAYARNRTFFQRRSLMLASPGSSPAVAWRMLRGPGQVTLVTGKLQARVNLTSGTVTFLDHRGQTILAEKSDIRRLLPVHVQGEDAFNVHQEWNSYPDESLYGLGQHQLGLVDIKGYDLDLWQHNTNVVIPFLVSSRGYGILWDNTSFSRFGNLRLLTPIPAALLVDTRGMTGGVTVSEFSDRQFGHCAVESAGPFPDGSSQPGHPRGDDSVRWEGYLVPAQTGIYTFQAFSNGGIRFWVDGRLAMNHWRQSWLPGDDVVRVSLQAGRRCRLRLDWTRDQGADTMRLFWKTPSADASTSLWSQVGDGLDYDFVYGPSLDTVIAGYRRLTGTAPLMPQWAYGLWQSRERYQTQQQSLEVVDGFRSRGIPFDNIVQDWFYWPAAEWGSHTFDPARFPDPVGWIDTIHARHVHLMISVWGKFYPGTTNFNALNERGYLYQPTLTEGLHDWVGYPYSFYDSFNAGARSLYWSQINEALFQKHVDAWWMDASEPDMLSRPSLTGTLAHMMPTAGGTPARVLNAWSLENSRAVYEGQRAAAPDQRVFILTRSGFAGTQRYATATWSGDISSTWTAMQKQIAAGLGLSVSGVPYWTMDTGGFSVPNRFADSHAAPADVDEWRELNARWFEFAAFVPLLRVHGQSPYREMWQFGGESSPAYKAELEFDRLRYRMFPYLYSVAGSVTHDGSTMMRPLVMDFRNDITAREISDQYMFGPAFLVSPVTTYRARARYVYLPATPGGWYDFWTGRALGGGRRIVAPAPYDRLPLDIKAGSLIPVGPEQEYIGQKKADPITLYVYAGADGSFTLYEDDGLTYGYEHGAFACIPLRWDNAEKTLTIARRTGVFRGILVQRTFNIVLVSPSTPVGYSPVQPSAARIVRYNGRAVVVRLQ